ncbi:hypothetical protein HGRIS_010509 [Hohenbuehelia grisea]|uniref:Uncharacterized protein n=1 Tax=Hohenbuehelia grisea TaxID=104357 RepID=A0ABR3IXA6_9AGAR
MTAKTSPPSSLPSPLSFLKPLTTTRRCYVERAPQIVAFKAHRRLRLESGQCLCPSWCPPSCAAVTR